MSIWMYLSILKNIETLLETCFRKTWWFEFVFNLYVFAFFLLMRLKMLKKGKCNISNVFVAWVPFSIYYNSVSGCCKIFLFKCKINKYLSIKSFEFWNMKLKANYRDKWRIILVLTLSKCTMCNIVKGCENAKEKTKSKCFYGITWL